MNIWKSLADKFDNLLPRTTAVFVKETDYSLGITYPLEELQTAFNFIFSDDSTYDLPPKFTFYFGAYENSKEIIRLRKNRPLFTKCVSYPGLIKRELNFANIGLSGVERMGQRKSGALTLNYHLTCINPSDDFHNNLYSILKSQEVFKASVKNGVITIKFKDMKYYIASNTEMEVGLYADEFTMLKDLEKGVKLNKQGHFLVIKQKFSVLPKEILDLPKYGCINGHASLLPKLRGASPIQWSIVTGETKTGVSTMLMDEGMDTGDILETVITDIGAEETAEELFDRLAVMSADLMVSTLKKAQAGTLNPTRQNDAEATYAPIIKKEMAHIDFTKTADEICNAVRGFYSWPCAFCFINDKRVKVIKAKKSNLTSQECGIVLDSDNRLVISCKGGSVELVTVQPEGAKVMTASQMLNGHAILKGTVIK